MTDVKDFEAQKLIGDTFSGLPSNEFVQHPDIFDRVPGYRQEEVPHGQI